MRVRVALPLVLLVACCFPTVRALAQKPAANGPAIGAKAVAASVSHGRFEQVPVHRPAGEPKRFVLWFADGMSAAGQARIEALVADGAMVAVVDTTTLESALSKDGGNCIFSAGDVENFSHYVQAYYRAPTYHLPVLMGDGEGAALAYAVATLAPASAFAGVVSVDFCPVLALPRAMCGQHNVPLAPAAAGAGVSLQPMRLPMPWLVANDAHAKGCPAQEVDAFVAAVPQGRMLKHDAQAGVLPGLLAAVNALGAQPGVSVAPPPTDLHGLPVVEVPANGHGHDDTFAIFVSGDGGWAGLDKQVAEKLAQAGMPVVGVDSLRYFWTPRTPQGFAVDLERIMRYYSAHLERDKVLLIGFSQGADVLPAAINHLPAGTRDKVALIALLSPGKQASYEFHLSNWLGSSHGGLPLAPEMARLPAEHTLCLYGQDDGDAICPHLPVQGARQVRLPGDHHFKGDYARLAEVLLQHLDGREN